MSKGNYNGLIINEQTIPVIESMAEGLPGGFFIYHADGDEEFIYVNSQMIKIMGCRTEKEFRKLTGNSFKGLVHADEIDAVEEDIQRQIGIHPDMIDRVNYRVVRADGKMLWIDESGHFVHTEMYGDVFYVFVIDVTDEHEHKMQKRLESQLKMVDALCRDYLNVYLVDIEQKSVKTVKLDGYAIPGLSKQTDAVYDYDTLWEKYIGERVHPADAEMLAEAVRTENLKEVLEAEGEYAVIYRVIEDGNTHYYQAKFTRMDECADMKGIVIVSFQNMDAVVEKKLADAKELEDAKDALETALEEAVRARMFAERFMDTFDSAYYVDIPKNSCIVYRQQKYTSEEYKRVVNDYFGFAGRYLSEGVAEEDRERLAFTANPDGLREWLRSHADGSDSTVLFSDISMGYRRYVRLYVIPGEDDNHVQIGYTDIDERIRKQKAQEKALEQALAAADKANKAKTDFFFNLSHDIRTPMNVIIGFIDLLSKYEEDRERRKDYIKKIQKSSRYLLELINNVLEMARIESGKMSLNESAWSMEELNDSLEFIFSGQLKKKNLRFVSEVDIHSQSIVCDATKVKEIFVNLISNAIKYTPEGGSVTMKIAELPSNRKGYAVFKSVIEDTGIGMSKEFLPHIFEDFSREKNLGENRVIGTGLGMPIVKKMIDLMNGSIEVESEYGKGTRITFFLTCKINNEAEKEPHHGTVNESGSIAFNQKRILLAEDNELNAEIAVEILQAAGFEVEHAADGRICVDMLQKAAEDYYDLILMDVQMPELNGYQATHEIRNLPSDRRNVPIIAMTANAFEEDKQNALASGMDGHIAKPIEIPKLMDTLNEILGRSARRSDTVHSEV